MDKKYWFGQLDTILGDCSSAIHSRDANFSDYMMAISRAKAAVERIAGTTSEYYKDISYILKWKVPGNKMVEGVEGVLYALKSDLENDYLKRFHDIVQSELFSDYLEMADYLLNQGYKDAAAVIIGSTLEANLRELCKSNSIEIEYSISTGVIKQKKAEILNQDLAKAKIYSKGQQKQITAWLDIRNNAAHGKYNEYILEQVKLMLEGIRQFLFLK